DRLAPPERSYREALERDPGRLRVAFSTRSPIGTAVDPAAIVAVERTARLLEELGHHVEPAEPEIDGRALARDFLRIWFAQIAYQLRAVRRRAPQHARDFELDTLSIEAAASGHSACDYATRYSPWLEEGVRPGP